MLPHNQLDNIQIGKVLVLFLLKVRSEIELWVETVMNMICTVCLCNSNKNTHLQQLVLCVTRQCSLIRKSEQIQRMRDKT